MTATPHHRPGDLLLVTEWRDVHPKGSIRTEFTVREDDLLLVTSVKEFAFLAGTRGYTVETFTLKNSKTFLSWDDTLTTFTERVSQ